MAVPQAHGQSTFTQSSPQPEFLQATPGQQFGFRVPYTAFQAESNTQAPPRTRFGGLSSQPSSKGSGPPSSRSPSLFLGGSMGTSSTAATSRAPSICSSKGERCPTVQRDPSPQCTVSATSFAPRISVFEHFQTDATLNSTRLQQTASFYNVPLSMNKSGHSLSAAPDYDDMGEIVISHAINQVNSGGTVHFRPL